MKKILILSLFFAIAISSNAQIKTGYNIDFRVKGLKDSSVYLAYHFGDKQYIKDTLKLDNEGRAIFSGDIPLPQGIYMMVLPGRKYFEMLISDDQFFSITCGYPDFFKSLEFSGSEENTAFILYQKTWSGMQYTAQSLGKRIQNNKENQDSLKILTQRQKEMEVSMKNYLKDIAESNKGNLLAALVNAMLPLEVPEFKIPEGIKNPDSLRWVMDYNYKMKHFFDRFDLTSERLLRTPILQSQLDFFFSNIVIQSPDSINAEIDRLIPKCSSNYKVFQFVAVFLFNHFRESEIMGHDAVMVKIADDIYLSGKADWVTPEFKTDLKKQIDLIRPNLIGKKGQNLVMDSYKGIFVSLYDVEKEFTILVFWEPDCGHCKEALPKLKAYYEKARNENIEIFAVCTTSDKTKWSKYIEENGIKWINGWDPNRISHFDYYYNVQSTPLIYVLDRDKKIIAKKLGVENLESFIENYRKYFKK